MIIRSGCPKVIRGTAPQVPAAAVNFDGAADQIQPFIFWQGKPTTWVRIENTGANVLRVFFLLADVLDVAPASYDNYLTVATSGVLEAPIEIPELSAGALIIMAEGGTSTFQALIAQRVV